MKFSSLISALCIFLITSSFEGLNAQPVNDVCSFATDIQAYIQQQGQPEMAGPYSNVGATGNDLDIVTVTGCWLDDLSGNADGSSPQVDATVWFQFDGYDGEVQLYVQPCDSTIAFLSQDTQMALYRGECDSLQLVACNEDIDDSSYNYWSGITVPVQAGIRYYLAVDGFNYSGFGSPDIPLTTGEFCLSFTQPVVSVKELSAPIVNVFPNPSQGAVWVKADAVIREIGIYNSIGQLSAVHVPSKSKMVECELPASPGVYTLLVRTEEGSVVYHVLRN